MSELLFNELPRPTFRWLRVNHTPASLWGESDKTTAVLVKGNDAIISPLPSGTALINTNYKGTKEATNIQYLNEYDVKSNAKIVVKKVNLLDETVQHIEHRYTKLEDNADVEYINVEIGGKENFLNYEHDLQGESSKIVHDIAYLGNKEQKFDIAMLMTHGGKKSFSDIHTLGALSDTSKKSFRGTLDFLRGAVASEGAEEDTCLLLDPTVKSISLPLLLCKEDNVVGNHAASAGQIDQNKLFYLMSRGFSEVEAKHIIVESMIRPIIDRIGDDVIEEAALTAVRNKI